MAGALQTFLLELVLVLENAAAKNCLLAILQENTRWVSGHALPVNLVTEDDHDGEDEVPRCVKINHQTLITNHSLLKLRLQHLHRSFSGLC